MFREQKKNAKPRYACKYGDVCWEHDYPHRKEFWHPAEEKNPKEYWAKYEAIRDSMKRGENEHAERIAAAKAGAKAGAPSPPTQGALPPPPPPEEKKPGGPDPEAGVLVDKANPGGGILVDTKTIGRQVKDTRSGSVYISDLPKNFQGGDEALHFALGELFGQFGKIKKIELYMDEGILETKIFKGEALVVYHPTKFTGKMEKGDPVWEACTELDGRYRVLGYRHWRIRCEPAEWQRQGYNVKDQAKKWPCVLIENLWEYSGAMPLSWFMEVQEAIRKHAAEHIQNPFVKVNPSEGSAIIWAKGAQDAIKFAGIMQKSYFLGRKVVASLCRKEKPVQEDLPKLPGKKVGPSGMIELTMKLPEDQPVDGVADGVGGTADGQVAVDTTTVPGEGGEATAEPSGDFAEASMELAFFFREGSKVQLKGLNSKPENNGKKGEVVKYIKDLGKYQLKLEDGRTVKVKPENVEAFQEDAASTSASIQGDVEMEDEQNSSDAEAEAEAARAAAEAAANMAAGKFVHGAIIALDPNVHGFQASVCVDPSLLPKREKEEDKVEVRRRESSRSRERRINERAEAIKARAEANAKNGSRPSWVVPSPAEMAAQAATVSGGAAAGGAPLPKEPEQSREELLKLSVGKLKEMLKEFGKTARGCIEKSDFVDRLKPKAASN